MPGEPLELAGNLGDTMRSLSVLAAPLAVLGGWVLHLFGRRISNIEDRVSSNSQKISANQLEIKDTEVKMAQLRTYMSENFSDKADVQSSLARVHAQIEEGNRLTHTIRENIAAQIDALRRDIKSDIIQALQHHS
jgi:hypothetical protein